jgi:hypothetical protein
LTSLARSEHYHIGMDESASADALKLQEARWAEFLRSDKCPPVLGLAPLEESERTTIRDAVAAQLNTRYAISRFDALLAILKEYPASLATWLAREAGEAYDDGEFWSQFERLLGVSVPTLRRSELAHEFRFACGLSMRNFTAPAEKGAFIYVETFLHQAGLPVCQIPHFARFVRQVERTSGLPAPDDPGAGKELSDRLVEVVHPALVTLRRALRGVAGALTCEVALQVIFSGDYAGVNPHLREELARQFSTAHPDSVRRSPRAPFLRLSADLCALELVGPRQDPSVIGAGGLRWMVNGRRQPVASFDEFVHPLGDEESVSVELQGLRDGQTLSRAFALRLEGRRPPCLLFDAGTRLPPRVSGEGPIAVRAGSYWFLHRASHDFVDATERIVWSDGERALSLVALKPGTPITLRDDRGVIVCEIGADAAPCFIPVGRRVISDDGDVLHYGWSKLPTIWLSNAAENDWTLTVASDGEADEIRLAPDSGNTAGTLTACRPLEVNPLAALRPGLREVTLTLNRRGRPQLRQAFLIWMGLTAVDSDHFVTDTWPENLMASECLGFKLAAPDIRHAEDQNRAHRLAFHINGTTRIFQWCRPGTFLESFTRKAGTSIQPCPEAFGTTFSAGSDSTQWLRIWRTGTDFAEVRINGVVLQIFGGEAGRPFVDVSLASLALLYPQGGTLTLRHCDFESPLARFSRPLSVTAATTGTTAEARRLNLIVGDQVELARIQFQELLGGRTASTDPVEVTLGGSMTLTVEGLPAVTLECLPVPNGVRLIWSVPRGDWPSGIWICELELRRAQDTEWQPLSTTLGERLPLRVEGSPEPPPEGFRARALWSNISPQIQVGRLVEDGAELNPDDALGLLNELLPWREQSYHSAVAKYFEWVDGLSSWLCRRMSTVIHRDDESPALRLLHLASGARGRRFFVDVPSLLALPAHLYQQIGGEEPLIQSLALCGRLVASETVVSSFVAGQVDLDFGTLAKFSNFNTLAANTSDIAIGDEFADFNFASFWQQTMGPLDAERRDADWASHMPGLSRIHALWAVERLDAAYEAQANNPRMGAVNGLLQTAGAFRTWLQGNVLGLPPGAWNSPWLEVAAGNALVPAAAKFASLLALAARAGAAGRFDFSTALIWLDQQAGDPDRTREAISTLVDLAPELFGFHLVFWELIFRTHPYHA